MFQDTLPVPSSRSSSPDCWTLEDGTDRLSRNVSETSPGCLSTRKTKDLTTDIALCIQTPWLSEYEIGVNADCSPILSNRTDRMEQKTKKEELFIMRHRKFSEVVYVGLEMTDFPTDILVH